MKHSLQTTKATSTTLLPSTRAANIQQTRPPNSRLDQAVSITVRCIDSKLCPEYLLNKPTNKTNSVSSHGEDFTKPVALDCAPRL